MTCPICKGNKVTTINENMLCLGCGYQEYLYDYGNACDYGYRIYQPEEQPAPAPASASQPWDQRQQYQIDQTRAGLIAVRRILQEMTGKKLEPDKAQQQTQKSEYKGLVIGNDT